MRQRRRRLAWSGYRRLASVNEHVGEHRLAEAIRTLPAVHERAEMIGLWPGATASPAEATTPLGLVPPTLDLMLNHLPVSSVPDAATPHGGASFTRFTTISISIKADTVKLNFAPYATWASKPST